MSELRLYSLKGGGGIELDKYGNLYLSEDVDPLLNRTCEWVQKGGRYNGTGCGMRLAHSPRDGVRVGKIHLEPAKFCPYCGGEIVEVSDAKD